ALKRRPRIIIGTPGRIIDHLQRRTLNLQSVRYLVLDETDRMLDMGFSQDIETILGNLQDERQTLLFSATLPQAIVKLSKKYLAENAQRIAIGSTTEPSRQIKQETIQVSSGSKFTTLLTALEEREGSVIIFVKTKISADKLAEKLQEKDHAADAIHGDLNQRKRDRVIREFRNNKCRILVATDIAARGIDIPHIMHVINYDLPQCPEDYIHRIGRTGRAGMTGFALSFVSPDERHKWKAIHRLIHAGEETEGTSRGGGSRGGRDNRRGGYSGQRDGARGGYRGRRDEGSESRGGYRGRRDEGASESQGYRGRRDGAAASESQGYRGRREEGSESRSGYRGARRDNAEGSSRSYGKREESATSFGVKTYRKKEAGASDARSFRGKKEESGESKRTYRAKTEEFGSKPFRGKKEENSRVEKKNWDEKLRDPRVRVEKPKRLEAHKAAVFSEQRSIKKR
ncbi:MAG TPA: DEAD/DEAH box helicase, partial [Candidatus Berkiella sp.]|nr:DEAD/DEAH box helicase [Candidatus Berkiella sp.]